jgi:ribulose-phosphate 3-epimerase
MILPSVMAKSQKELNQLLKKLKGVSKHLHLDVVSTSYANNHSLDFKFKLKKDFSYQAHLMIKNPRAWIKANKKRVTLAIVQFEEINLKNYITWAKKENIKVAIALKPQTKTSQIKPFLKDIHTILILTVNPGFYGARFLKSPLKKIEQIKKINPKIKIIVDGHMNPKTIQLAKKAGADNFISGSFISKSDHPKKAIRELKSAIKNS